MRRSAIPPIVASALLLLVTMILAQGGYDLSWWTVDGGGHTAATGGPYELGGAIGQPDTGIVSGGGYAITGGFWSIPAWGIPAKTYVYLPLVLRRWPPIPDVPVLNPITNPDGVGTYTVTWSTSEFADTYVLEEDISAHFSDPTELCSGDLTSCEVSGRGAARYFYRVKACNQSGNSDWSNVEQVDVLSEREDNDKCAMANGPLISDLIYKGAFPEREPDDDQDDDDDYFYFHLYAAHTVGVYLTNIPEECDYDLFLYDEDLQEKGGSDEKGNEDEEIQTGVLSARKYYIRVYRYEGRSELPYQLRVIYED